MEDDENQTLAQFFSSSKGLSLEELIALTRTEAIRRNETMCFDREGVSICAHPDEARQFLKSKRYLSRLQEAAAKYRKEG